MSAGKIAFELNSAKHKFCALMEGRYMTVSELISYLKDVDPDATVFIDTELERFEAVCILEDKRGVYISSEE
jgi:hypothetical protein